MSLCIFDGCFRQRLLNLTKCDFHKSRSLCKAPACRNQVYARQLCVTHGGRRPCIHADCPANARIGPYCCRHGPKSGKKLCREPGCANIQHTKGKCIRHGGGRQCRKDHCETHARVGGFCWRHRTPDRAKGNTRVASPVRSPVEYECTYSTLEAIDCSILTALLAETDGTDFQGHLMLEDYFDACRHLGQARDRVRTC
ncbi:hypothetical protein SPRG_13560 [Saprolegnia parasitica CBS 223.65]|uniref:WRKY transcription factor 19 n=1 Tax=Saprolegnia parasitica (strain CBS 223.65) TaxID=695850 RepID=A0A067C3Z8_SAPPC|nr:hypothetical protein SPRG_13560 [Saprolegnia parasitica CBS 223.65]KDO21261.1 hypothetical protein SPRG_13560 [Saprolegnia parasitica CBS 223.65]|eukprot:XP_012208005.1 hypothetical protein SPRG_13560 [Saprolegnia parasitica CBS 223.65]